MQVEDIAAISKGLLLDEDRCEPVTPFSERFDNINFESAYDIQRETIKKRKNRGERVAGKNRLNNSH